MGFLCIVCMKKERVETYPFFILPSFFTFSLSSRKAMQRSTTLFLPSRQRLHKSQFLQKVSCQKLYWHQARLSSLINNQVNVRMFVHTSVDYPWMLKRYGKKALVLKPSKYSEFRKLDGEVLIN